MRIVLATLALALAADSQASAGPLFTDNFDSYSPMLNWVPPSNWTVTGRGAVDLIGVGSGFDLLPGNGGYVDLDGTGGGPGRLSTSQTFAAGNYTLSFSLAGNQRNSESDTVTVSLGSWSESFTVQQHDPFQRITRTFGTSGGALSFQNSTGTVANEGALLDNVSVSLPGVPEPATLTLLGGLAVAGFAWRRWKLV